MHRHLVPIAAAILALFIAAPRAAAAAELLLAENGAARLPIVISAKAAEPIKAVAKELADYLQRITGAAFDVTTGDGKTGIVLGTLAEFPDADLDKPLELRQRFDGREAYAIRTDRACLRLIGATDLGTSHAAFR